MSMKKGRVEERPGETVAGPTNGRRHCEKVSVPRPQFRMTKGGDALPSGMQWNSLDDEDRAVGLMHDALGCAAQDQLLQ